MTSPLSRSGGGGLALLLLACAQSHVAGPDAGSIDGTISVDAGVARIASTRCVPPGLEPGAYEPLTCAAGTLCCPDRGCITDDDGNEAMCGSCDDDDDCAGGVCCEGPYARDGGLRFACVAESECTNRVCDPAGACRSIWGVPPRDPDRGEIACGWDRASVCTIDQRCCTTECVPDEPDACAQFWTCDSDDDCVARGSGHCCSEFGLGAHLARFCRALDEPCEPGP